MGLCLAVDTTSPGGSLALARGDEIVRSSGIEAGEGFGAVLFDEIRELLEGLALREIDVFAAAAGPGSFTGVRIGLTAMQSLAEADGKRVAPVSNLEALASAVSGAERIAPVLDARRGEVYAAVFDSSLEAVVEQAVLPWDDFRSLADGATFVSTSGSIFEPGGAAPLADDQPRQVVERLAEQVARIAGPGLLPEHIEPNYIRRPDAERNWRPPR